MKFIPFVPDFRLKALSGEPCIDSEEGKPIIKTHRDFLLDRVADPVFAARLDTSAMLKTLIKARDEICDQAEEAKTRGYWAIEDDRADRLKDSTLKGSVSFMPSFPGNGLLHNFMPFVEAAEAMSDKPPEQEKK